MQRTYCVGSAFSRALKFGDTAMASVEMTIELNGGASHLLNDLTNKLDLDRGRVIAEALSLMYHGVTAQQDGMQMAIVDQGGTLQTALDLLPGN